MIRRYWYWVLLLGGVLACGEEREAEVRLWSSKCGGVADSSQVASSWDSLCYCVQEGADAFLPAVAVGSGDTLSAYQLSQGAKAYTAGELQVADSLWQEAWAGLDTSRLVYPDLKARILARQGKMKLFKAKEFKLAQGILYEELSFRKLMSDTSSLDLAMNHYRLAISHRNLSNLIFGKAHALMAYRLSSKDEEKKLVSSTLYEVAGQHVQDSEHIKAKEYYDLMLSLLPEKAKTNQHKRMKIEACMNACAANDTKNVNRLMSEILNFEPRLKKYGVQRMLRGLLISQQYKVIQKLLDLYSTEDFPYIRMKYHELREEWKKAERYSRFIYDRMSSEEIDAATQGFNEDSDFLGDFAFLQCKIGDSNLGKSIFNSLIMNKKSLEELVSLHDKHHYLDFMHGVYQNYLDILAAEGDTREFVEVLKKAKNNVMRLFLNNSNMAKQQASIQKLIAGKSMDLQSDKVLKRLIELNSVSIEEAKARASKQKPITSPHINFFMGDTSLYSYAASLTDTLINKLSSTSLDKPLELIPQDWLSKQDTVYIIPDGPMMAIDFRKIKLNQGQYLSEAVVLRFAFDHFMSDKNIQSDAILGMAFTDLETIKSARSPFAELPGTISEIKRLESRGAKAFYGMESTFDNYQKEYMHYKTIHLALHGTADPASLDSPFLVFRAPNSSSTVDSVYMYDILNLDHSGKNIVLSACSTGAGKHINSEGIYSIARAFKLSGANQLSISFQEIEDYSSSLLYTFY